MSIDSLKSRIKPLDAEAMRLAQARQNMLTKPAGSLGRLEELSIQVAGITRQPNPCLREKEYETYVTKSNQPLRG